MKKLFFALAMLFTTLAQGQMAHRQGQLLVQFNPEINPSLVIENYQRVAGIETGVQLDKMVSAPLNLYLVTFESFEFETELLKAMSSDKNVGYCQFNHFVQSRETVPNDPQLEQQWHHINDDNNGGTNDADIDTDLAWDVTTGGVTAAGDTIVVCVIEGGNLTHPDLIENAWFNYGEIPDNGIDDDANGYTDDYNGWNVSSNNDDGVFQGNHGTSVMGMIGAKGNNDLGVVGANWDVKIMSVAGESTSDEMSVVAAYTYALDQRKLYNTTDGERGAFVVATNASWGIDFGDISEVPVWAALYDTLGIHGILNCGATANLNINIDVQGDIPTAAPSDYMISVTATNFNDIRTFSGYGAETIDLGAPGEDVRTTSGLNGYTTTSGTSFASPLTAGVIGLMYSVPCSNFIDAVHENPQFGADYVRQTLFAGVDPIENLEVETVTGGRLNANNSIQLMVTQCADDFCSEPIGFYSTAVNDTLYNFSWTIAGQSNVAMRFRQEGSNDWLYTQFNDVNEFAIDTLSRCAIYEFEIANNCDGSEMSELNYTHSLMIETAGCCAAPETLELEQLDGSATLSWNPIFGVDEYEVYVRLAGETNWNLEGITSESNFVLTNLEECTAYEVAVAPGCNSNLIQSELTSFISAGCGNCLDAEFCPSYADDSSFEYIDIVEIGEYINESGNNDGYEFFSDTGLELMVGQSHETTLTPGFEDGAYGEYFSLWVDLNQDGDFGVEELLLQSEIASSEPLSGEIAIPFDAPLGSTRMRIQMKYVGNGGPGQTNSCDLVDEGEVEEYCLTLVDETNSIFNLNKDAIGLTIFPNPNAGQFTLQISKAENLVQNDFSLEIYDMVGKRVIANTLLGPEIKMDVSLKSGLYQVVLKDAKGEIQKSEKLLIQ